ncbi:type II toxin-antitoxin system VapC family toxin [Desulfurococcus amylolyticus]|uniref:PilT protein domain protein n=1 Tax=Desulfurococcus amylolyticus DSM 16532 TaxID=768672 RepID=I3XQX3_DESAM|nr:type II toxin-antitoxin system VapC family toxin [Desulfurococcus amylolyticus]AFL66347.1 PilT protein domain protein [Desulfurococcus amylolyticus DSM 16532]
MIVVDASALLAFFLKEEGWDRLAEYMTLTLSVDHVVKEFYNTIWKAVYIRKTMSVEDAKKVIEIFKKYREKNMVLEPEDKYIDMALDISIKHGLTVYDSLYIAQALHNKKPLLTLDDKQRSIAERLGVRVIEIPVSPTHHMSDASTT